MSASRFTKVARFTKAASLVERLIGESPSPVVDPLTPENYTKKLDDIVSSLTRKGIGAVVDGNQLLVALPDDSNLVFGVEDGVWGHSQETPWKSSDLAEDDPMQDVLGYILETVHGRLDGFPTMADGWCNAALK